MQGVRVAQQVRLYFVYNTGQHSKMPVCSILLYTAAAKCLEQCYVSCLASGDYTTRVVVEQVSTFNH